MWSSPRLLKSLVETDREREGVRNVNRGYEGEQSENKEEEKETKLWVICINRCKFLYSLS